MLPRSFKIGQGWWLLVRKQEGLVVMLCVFTRVHENMVQLWSLVYRVKGPLCPRQEESAARFAVFLRFGAFCLRSSLLEEFFLV